MFYLCPMQIRAATADDISAIVHLLRISLGESLMPKSEVFWRWKHLENPFGPSPVLVAEEAGVLVGVRAFMRWKWVRAGNVWHAMRAVDTATHPDHQGKGIFKRMTLDLVKQCEAEGIHFIYNTPNANSKPGYLKMGWSTLGRMKIYVRPLLFGHAKSLDFEPSYSIHKLAHGLDWSKTAMLHWQTPNTFDFLLWRYVKNPNVAYYYFCDDEQQPSYLTIFRLKPYRLGVEFRVCFSIVAPTSSRLYHKHLMDVARAAGANLITSATRLPGFSLGVSAGPTITVRNMASSVESISFNNWAPTLGDMEVF